MPTTDMPDPDPAGSENHDRADPTTVAGAMVYDQLRQVARRYVRREPLDLTVEATGLVHEVYLRLHGGRMPVPNDDAHFVAMCARLMRQILVTRARRRGVRRRVHRGHADALDRAVDAFEARCPRLDRLDEALERLERLDPRKASVIELRFFAGLAEQDIADLLDVSPRTARREWMLARGWLRRELEA